MPNVNDFDRTTKESRAAHKQRVQEITSGERGSDGLTDAERALIAQCRQQGLELCGGFLDTPSGQYWHPRIIRREKVRL